MAVAVAQVMATRRSAPAGGQAATCLHNRRRRRRRRRKRKFKPRGALYSVLCSILYPGASSPILYPGEPPCASDASTLLLLPRSSRFQWEPAIACGLVLYHGLLSHGRFPFEGRELKALGFASLSRTSRTSRTRRRRSSSEAAAAPSLAAVAVVWAEAGSGPGKPHPTEENARSLWSAIPGDTPPRTAPRGGGADGDSRRPIKGGAAEAAVAGAPTTNQQAPPPPFPLARPFTWLTPPQRRPRAPRVRFAASPRFLKARTSRRRRARFAAASLLLSFGVSSHGCPALLLPFRRRRRRR